MKKNVMILSAVAMLSATMISTFAFSQSAIDALAPLTGLSNETIVELRESGATFMEIANEYGVEESFLETFKAIKIERIQDKLADGKITSEQAAAAIEKIESMPQTCVGDAEYFKLNLSAGKVRQARLNQKNNN